MWCLGRLSCVLLALLTALVDASGVVTNGLTCPSADKEGSPLDTSLLESSKDGVPFDMLCNYSSGASCAYNNGVADTADSEDRDNLCPSSLVAASSQSSQSKPRTPGPTNPTSTTSSPQTSPAKSSPTTGNIGSSLSRLTSPTEGLTTKSNRNSTRTAVIAGSIVSVCFLVGLLLLVLWVMKRRGRDGHVTFPEQYIYEGQRSQPNGLLRPKHLRADDKFGGSSQPDSTPVDPESAVLSDTRADGGIPAEEALALRMRRMEERLEALLTVGLPEGSPPSYTG